MTSNAADAADDAERRIAPSAAPLLRAADESTGYIAPISTNYFYF
jgi:hypothetical protein